MTQSTDLAQAIVRTSARNPGSVLSQNVLLTAQPTRLVSRLTGSQLEFFTVVSLSSISRNATRIDSSLIDAQTSLSSIVRVSGRLIGSGMQADTILSSVSRFSARYPGASLVGYTDLMGRIRLGVRIPGAVFIDSTGIGQFGILPLDMFFDTADNAVLFEYLIGDITFDDPDTILDLEGV